MKNNQFSQGMRKNVDFFWDSVLIDNMISLGTKVFMTMQN